VTGKPTSSALLIAAAVVFSGADVVDPPSPASGDAQVVAQGLAPFRIGEYHWVVETVPITSAASTIAVGGPTFVIADGPGGVLVGPRRAPPTWRLAAGEAAFAGGDEPLVALASGPAGGSLTLISPARGSASTAFTPGATVRDVDLVRDVLTTDEALRIDSEISALVYVAAGIVSAGDITIGAGTSLTIAGDITVINRQQDEAVVVAAVIGPAIAGEFAPYVRRGHPARARRAVAARAASIRAVVNRGAA
jgi:hypothetical protein